MDLNPLIQEWTCRMAETQAQNEMILEHLTGKGTPAIRKEVDLRAIEIIRLWKRELGDSSTPPPPPRN